MSNICMVVLFHWLALPWWFGVMAYIGLAEVLIDAYLSPK